MGNWQMKVSAAQVGLVAALTVIGREEHKEEALADALGHLYDARANLTEAIEALEEETDL